MQLIEGPRQLLQGFKLILDKELRYYIYVPIMLTFVLFIGFFLLVNHTYAHVEELYLGHLPKSLVFFEIILKFLFYLIIFALFAYLFTSCAIFIGSPFYSLLAEKVAARLDQRSSGSVSWVSSAKDVPRLCKRQVNIFLNYFSKALILMICSFFPLAQVIVIPLWFLLNAWFIAFQCIDYYTDNLKIPLSEVKKYLRCHFILVLSFGVSVLVLSMVPGLNVLIMPAAVAGGTQLGHKIFSAM